MTKSFPRPATVCFLISATVYLLLLSSINYPLNTVLKPIPILCLILGVMQSQPASRVKNLLLVALSFSLLGDIVLTLPIPLQIEIGIGFFGVAHCFFIALFVRHYQPTRSSLLYFSPVCIYSLLVFHTIVPHLGGILLPVCMYFCILFFMVFFAFQVSGQRLMIALGALSFMVSDTLVAYSLFVSSQIHLGIEIMFTYYVAQWLLTIGLLGLYKREVEQKKEIDYNKYIMPSS